ncbi:putative multicatalytic endopeptidase complex chain PRE1 [Lentinula lateritia]|uniref:Multicatalytic endopeptidase complex chain PRE1 n=1 Tax=Lentinula lateritia TaxID=40482 RepID=A0ABQ8VJG4_9AGAR|nr:putative multicatalytic endopeptidase complex chain PRE1 [Lentinula lateritia]
METSFAITGKGYVIVASDTTAARSIVKMKTDDDKIKAVSPHLLMSYSGEPGMHSVSYTAAASWIRRSLAQSLCSRKPYSVNLMLGGFDVTTDSPHLYWIDYLGTMTEVPFGGHGYGSYFALSLLDRCIDEVTKRLVVSPGKYKIKVVDKDGTREVKL